MMLVAGWKKKEKIQQQNKKKLINFVDDDY
jgi:hypothetical protein